MDDIRKQKYKDEVEKRADILWDDFLKGMSDLGYTPDKHNQNLVFHNERYRKVDMRGRKQLNVPEKSDGKL